jgi:hypothetical protein
MPQQRDPNAKQEQVADLEFPVFGIDLVNEFELQRDSTTPVGLNVRGWEPATQRNRGGSRNGISKWLDALVNPIAGAMQIQDLNIIVTSNIDNLLTQYGGDLFNTGGFIINPQFPQWVVPLFGSGIQLNQNTGATAPSGANNWFGGTVTGGAVGGGYNVALVPQPGGATVVAQSLAGSGTVATGSGVIAVQSGDGKYYFQPPTFVS